MRVVSLASLLLLGGCVAAAPVAGDGIVRSEEGTVLFDPAKARRDLETSARQQYGDAMVERALAAPGFLFARHYPGMLPPPPPDAGPNFRYPDPPVAMLMREDGRWLAARGAAFVLVAAEKGAALDTAIGEAAFWREPAWAPPGCTDAGGSFLWLKMPRRPVLVRQGVCGNETGRTERLVFLGLDAALR